MTLPDVEAERLESLDSYDSLDGVDLDGLVSIAAAVCRAPVAYLGVVEASTVRFLASSGTPESPHARAGAFSSWVVDNQSALVVDDVGVDPRFNTAPHIVGRRAVAAYAGIPLVGRDGLPLGSLSVVDWLPRRFSANQLRDLRVLAEAVVSVLELRRLDRAAGAPFPAEQLGRRLRRALDQGELRTWFTPVVALDTGSLHGYSASLQWKRPRQGLIAPGVFLPAVERSGLALPLGRFLLHEALRTTADLDLDEPMSVPLSPAQLASPGLAASVLADLEAHALDPSRLIVEVTGSGSRAVRQLRLLRDAGVGVALSGHGCASAQLQLLADLPLSAIELNASLVGRVADSRVRAVLRAGISLARELGLDVTAEGVDTEEQRRGLAELGCGSGQGRLFSAAVPARDLPSLVARLTPEHRTDGPCAKGHALVVEGSRFVAVMADRLQQALQAPGGVVLAMSDANRVAVEREVASRGVDVTQQNGYTALRGSDGFDWDAVPAGATVVTDAPGRLWAEGDVPSALALEQRLARLPVTVVCGFAAAALVANGTPEQVRRLHDQHDAASGPSPVGLDVLAPGGRDLVERMLAAGASHHSIAAALGNEGFASPYAHRWHHRQVQRLLSEGPALPPMRASA